MTPEIALTLAILALAIILFVTERIRVDLVALFVLVTLAITALVTPAEALSGFSNPAVITVWAVFILSAGLYATGVANILGRQVLRIAGQGEVRLLIVIMLTAAILSAFMNNVGVAALLLPVVLTIAKKTSIPASKLLLPLAIGCLLGGMMTLIGTPPNILASDALREAGLEPFSFFSFAPVGIILVLTGITFMVLVGRRLLPSQKHVHALPEQDGDISELYDLDERLALIELPANSPLAGKTLIESRIGRALGLTVMGLQRNGRKQRTLHNDTILEGGDQLLALGRLDRLHELRQKPYLIVDEDSSRPVRQLFSQEIGLAELEILIDSIFIGRTISEIDIRRKYGFNVLAIQRGDRYHRTNLQEIPLRLGDKLLLQGSRSGLEKALEDPHFGMGMNILGTGICAADLYELHERLMFVRIPPESSLVGQTLAESDLDDSYGLLVVSIVKGEQVTLAPGPETEMSAGDLLLVEGKPDDLAILRGLQSLIIHRQIDMEQVELETEMVGLVEAVLSPHTTSAGKTLREIQFREKFNLSVLAILRDGRAYRSDLGNMPLQFGDAFLIYGSRAKFKMLSGEPDFIVLTEEIEEAPRRDKALLATLIMAGVIITVLIGWLPIAIAAIAGSALMIVTGCLQIEDAYRQIDWRAVFLIAGMLPLGIAMEQSGAAQYLAEGMIALVGDSGPTALLAGMFLLTSIASQFMPNAVVTVLMAPIALSTAADLNLSPYTLMMVVAIAASAAFMSPVGHPANVLVMGPGGYRFSDYLKVGIPLTIVVLIITLIVLPIFWPL
jgi:di/tricarboxylate transporter